MIGDRTAPGDNSSLIARHIQGMIFLGTPFRGSRHAKWGNILNNIAHAVAQSSSKLRDLQEKSEKLKILAEAFPEVLRKRDIEGPRIGVAFFIEPLKHKGLLIVLKRTRRGYQAVVITRVFAQTTKPFVNLIPTKTRDMAVCSEPLRNLQK